MGKRGPKPIDVRDLQSTASQWAVFLFALRDGQPGAIYKVEGPWKKIKWNGKVYGRVPTRTIAAKVFPVGGPLLPELKTKDWHTRPPVLPEPRAWKQLKQARSVRHLQQTIHRLDKWEKQAKGLFPGEHIGHFPSIEEFIQRLRSSAKNFLLAKRLPSHPKSIRPKSDDKRIQFFAKVLAGSEMGIRPAYAVKLLSRWRLPKGYIEQRWTDLIENRSA